MVLRETQTNKGDNQMETKLNEMKSKCGDDEIVVVCDSGELRIENRSRVMRKKLNNVSNKNLFNVEVEENGCYGNSFKVWEEGRGKIVFVYMYDVKEDYVVRHCINKVNNKYFDVSVENVDEYYVDLEMCGYKVNDEYGRRGYKMWIGNED